jgi:hypothetical protein
MTKRRYLIGAGVLVVAAAAGTGTALAAAGGAAPSPAAACKTAMAAQYAQYQRTGQPAGTEPAPCRQLPPSQLITIGTQILGGQ